MSLYAFYFRSVATITAVVQPRASATLSRSLNLIRERNSSPCVRVTKRKKNINVRNEERQVKQRKKERGRGREHEERKKEKDIAKERAGVLVDNTAPILRPAPPMQDFPLLKCITLEQEPEDRVTRMNFQTSGWLREYLGDDKLGPV